MNSSCTVNKTVVYNKEDYLKEKYIMNSKDCYFDDIVGYRKEKQELIDLIDFIKNSAKYNSIGVRAPKGILLVGDPGTGKTLMAKALANEVDIPFYNIGNEFSMHGLFENARKSGPCIMFLDEIDKMGDGFMRMFGPDAAGHEIRELLTEMDGFRSNDGIVLIATANSTKNLHPSLLRSGRFDRIIHFNLPNNDERQELFLYYLKNKIIDDDVSIDELVRITSGVSCADIDNIVNEATLLMIKYQLNSISKQLFEEAIDRVTCSSVVERDLTYKERREIAIHEVGHAVVGIVNGKGAALNKIIISRRGGIFGFNRYDDENNNLDIINKSKKEMKCEVEILFGGYIAELIYLKDISDGSNSDLNRALKIINSMIIDYGMEKIQNLMIHKESYRDIIIHSEYKKREINKAEIRLIKTCYRNTKRKLVKNKKLFNLLYETLMDKHVLYKEDINLIIEKSKIKHKDIQKEIRIAKRLFGNDIIRLIK